MADQKRCRAPTPHPELLALRARLASEGLTPPEGADIATVRAYLSRLAEATKGSSAPVARENIIYLRAAGRDVPCKLYLPDSEAECLLLYAHGGGFRHGSLADWDAPLRQIVRESGVAILSLGYALAPEYPFPQAFREISEIVAKASLGRFKELRPFDRYALGGDSAGANLALGAAIALRDAGLATLKYLMLLYGVYSLDRDRPSWSKFEAKSGHGLSRMSMEAYWSTYLPGGERDWRVQPIEADLALLPPTRLTVGNMDPLLDENLALSEKLRNAGVAVELSILAGMPHGFLRFNEAADVVRRIVTAEARALRDAMCADK